MTEIDHTRGLCGEPDLPSINGVNREECERNPPKCKCCGTDMYTSDCTSFGMQMGGMFWLHCPACPIKEATEGEPAWMNEWQLAVLDFHKAFGHAISISPSIPSEIVKTLRIRLITEEVIKELVPALENDDLEGIADGIGDAIYVILGTAISYGINMTPIFNAIQTANMAKLGPDKKPLKDAGGKTIKPEGWKPPNIQALIDYQQKHPLIRL